MVEPVPTDAEAAPNPFGEADVLVAILMRTRDRPLLLARALASVLSQEHGDWHLFLVNDGGDPAAVEVLLARHETGLAGRVSVLHQLDRQGGPLCVDAALLLLLSMHAPTGRPAPGLVALHDDDDSWHPGFLSRTVAWLAAPEHASFVAVSAQWRVVHERLDRDGVIEDRCEDAPPLPPVLGFDAMLGRPLLPIGALLFRRAAVAAQGSVGTDAPGAEDWAFVLRLMASGDIGVLAERLLFRHRRDADAPPAYRNSVRELEGAEAIGAQAIGLMRQRNARIRAVLRCDPGSAVLLGAFALGFEQVQQQVERGHDRILANLDRNGLWGHARHEDLQTRLIRVEQMLSELGARLGPGQAPGQAPEQAPGPAHPLSPPLSTRPLWKRAARRLAGPLIDRVRRHSA